ncbi:MAG: bifunctional DNA primase/polymerase [Pirellulaceae bacterium]|nr:bifunctional DNA primase/polymerase [Pirellulaceae bacterium]
MNSLQDAALRYADLGYPVFPCAAGSKRPLTQHGFQDATVDLDQIDECWTVNPTANIGLATAELVVIDVDGHDNPWLADSPHLVAELAQACVATTPRGGRHYYFRQPAGATIRCSTGRIAPGVDVRGAGGYVLLPPSAVDGKPYQWVAGLELENPPGELSPPPDWLTSQLEGLATSPAQVAQDRPAGAIANEIPSGQRNATLARLAGTMRRVGMSRGEILAALERVNIDRCRPALSLDEVRRIAANIAQYDPDQIATAMAEDHFARLGIGEDEFEFKGLTSAELDAGNFELDYLIDGVLVKGQPGIIAGPKKALKTNISVDLTLSLCTGTPFLARFPVAKPIRAGLMSAESGEATMQETARRIALSKGLKLPPCELATWCFDVPHLKNFMHMKALRKFIIKNLLEVLILDPAYQMLAGVGDDAANMFVVGPLLKTLGDILKECNCTPILCHHFKKGKLDPYEPAELEDIAWAGFQEYFRQWFLLNRRVRYNPDIGGHHELWFQVGGSAGHSGMWGLNIDEGTRQTPGGRIWDVNLTGASEAREERQETLDLMKEAKKQKHLDRQNDQQRGKVLKVLRQYPGGETSRTLREAAKISGKVLDELLAQLIEEDLVVPCEIKKHTRKEPAYRLSEGGACGAS